MLRHAVVQTASDVKGHVNLTGSYQPCGLQGTASAELRPGIHPRKDGVIAGAQAISPVGYRTLPGVRCPQDAEVCGSVKQFELFLCCRDRLAHAAVREVQEPVVLHQRVREPQAIRLEWVRVAILVMHVGIGIDQRTVHPCLLPESFSVPATPAHATARAPRCWATA